MANVFNLGKIVGNDGVTPHIGENGNWFLADNDTNVRAQGPKGDTGSQGIQGVNGNDGQTPTFSVNSSGELIATYE